MYAKVKLYILLQRHKVTAKVGYLETFQACFESVFIKLIFVSQMDIG